MQADLAAFGVPAAALPPAAAPAAGFPVREDCWEAVQLFVAVATQWRREWIVGLGGAVALHVGLDYAGVHAAGRMMQVRWSRDLFEDIRVMEAAALEVLNSQAGR